MALLIKMPALSPTMTEGILAKWLVKEGDIIFIEDGNFHRVHNTSDSLLEFVCVFDGVRSH